MYVSPPCGAPFLSTFLCLVISSVVCCLYVYVRPCIRQSFYMFFPCVSSSICTAPPCVCPLHVYVPSECISPWCGALSVCILHCGCSFMAILHLCKCCSGYTSLYVHDPSVRMSLHVYMPFVGLSLRTYVYVHSYDYCWDSKSLNIRLVWQVNGYAS